MDLKNVRGIVEANEKLASLPEGWPAVRKVLHIQSIAYYLTRDALEYYSCLGLYGELDEVVITRTDGQKIVFNYAEDLGEYTNE